MNAFSDSIAVTRSGLEAQARRLQVLSENIANSDTPGYHRKLVSFETALGTDDLALVKLGRTTLDRTEPQPVYDPAHPMADEDGFHPGSNVDLIIEVADAREAQRSYEANLKMFEQARAMKRSLFELLRR